MTPSPSQNAGVEIPVMAIFAPDDPASDFARLQRVCPADANQECQQQGTKSQLQRRRENIRNSSSTGRPVRMDVPRSHETGR